MTIADLIEDMEKKAPFAAKCMDDWQPFIAAEREVARAMNVRNLFYVRIGSTVYKRWNQTISVLRDIPEASSVEVFAP